MSRLTTKIPISNFQVAPLALEQESIASQIDRMTQVIQSITAEKLSPSSRFSSSRAPSLDTFIDYGKYSVESSICDEEILNKLEKVSMAMEDFRSHEFRKSLNSISTNNLILDLTHDQLDSLVNDLEKLKNTSEIISESIININKKQLIIRLKSQPSNFINKKLISSNLSASFSKLQGLKLPKPPTFSITDLDTYMAQSFQDNFFQTSHKILPSPLNTTTASELNQSKSNQKEHQRLIDKLNWQLTEVVFIKETYNNKAQKLSDWESSLKAKQDSIMKQEQAMITQKLILDKDSEIVAQQKVSIFQTIEENKKKSAMLKTVLQELKNNQNLNFNEKLAGLEKKKSVESIVLKPRRNEGKTENDPEIQILEKEIQGIESQIKEDKKCPESIQIKLDRLKTRLSSLKSNRVISASIERSNSVTSKLNFLDRRGSGCSVNSLLKHNCDPQPLVSNNNINRSAKTFTLNSPKKQVSKALENTEGLHKYIKLRENRLTEKEEELSKRENMLINNLTKHPDNLGLVLVVQNEHRNLKILRNDLEKRQKNFEQQVLAQSRKCSELKAKEKVIFESIEQYEIYLNEKKQLESKLQFLLSILENSHESIFSSAGLVNN